MHLLWPAICKSLQLNASNDHTAINFTPFDQGLMLIPSQTKTQGNGILEVPTWVYGLVLGSQTDSQVDLCFKKIQCAAKPKKVTLRPTCIEIVLGDQTAVEN